MSSHRNTLASATTRDILAGLEARTPDGGYELELDGIESETPEGAAALNDAEANNLSFILSARFSRMDNSMTTPEAENCDTNYAQLAEKVARRLEELSGRLSGHDKSPEAAR